MPLYDYPSTAVLHTSWVHPEYQYWYHHWQSIRDCIWGETEIKRKKERYLPRMEQMTPPEYEAYLDRAVYFNMTQRTITGMLGTLFRRNPSIQNLPEGLDTANCSKNQQTFSHFVKEVAREVISMGRYGILLDMDSEGQKPPYFAGYITENIVDWSVQEIAGRWTLTEVVLRELRLARPLINPISLTPAGRPLPKVTNSQANIFSSDSAVTRAARRWIASYRVLRLEWDDVEQDYVYRQYYHTSDKGDASPEGTPYNTFTPTVRGKPYNFIPFAFIGPYDNTPDIDKSPIIDIVSLNLSHYKSYAQLEHGRFYTALPVYYAPVMSGQETGEYSIGPSVVWEVEKGATPGILEFHGTGLKNLQDACDKKEDQIAALGGRMVGVERVSAGESNNKVKLQEANEAALLMNISYAMDSAFTALLRWWALWQDVTPEVANMIFFECNKDFLSSVASAREFRAIQMMYEAGVLPIDVVYEYLKKAEVIPDWISQTEFKDMLDDPTSFPNNPDVLAKQEGAPDAKTLWEAEHVLVDPAVVAVRGYDSQAPEGQEPLPGQTQGGPVTAAQTAPMQPGAGDTVDADGNPVKALGPPPIPIVKGKRAPQLRNVQRKPRTSNDPTVQGTPLQSPGNRPAGSGDAGTGITVSDFKLINGIVTI